MTRILFGFALLLVGSLNAHPDYRMPLYEALHKAGYQCMLTQRIAKCYLSITLGIEAERHRHYLEGSVQVFEKNHQLLLSHAPTAEIRYQLEKVGELGKAYKTVYHQKHTPAHAAAVLELSNDILLACNTALTLLEHYAFQYEQVPLDCHLSSMIDYAEQQAMLSQRTLLYTLATRHHIGTDAINQRRLAQALSDFDAYQEKLNRYPDNTASIQEQLNFLAKKWLQLQQLLTIAQPTAQPQDKEQWMSAALDMSDQMLFASDELAFLYERLKELPEETALN